MNLFVDTPTKAKTILTTLTAVGVTITVFSDVPVIGKIISAVLFGYMVYRLWFK